MPNREFVEIGLNQASHLTKLLYNAINLQGLIDNASFGFVVDRKI